MFIHVKIHSYNSYTYGHTYYDPCTSKHKMIYNLYLYTILGPTL